MKLDVTTERKQTGGCAEISQQARNTYATCRVDGDTVYLTGVFYKCRDFFQDQVFDLTHDHALSVWGYHTKENPWDGKYLLCWFDLIDEAVFTAFERFNGYLLERGLPPLAFKKIEAPTGLYTLMGKTGPNNNLWLVETPSLYTQTLFSASLYTALIRLVYWLGVGESEKLSVQQILDDEVPVGTNERMALDLLEVRKGSVDIWKDCVIPVLNKGFSNLGAVDPEEWAKWMNDPNSGTIHDKSGIMCVWNSLLPLAKGEVTTKNVKESLKGAFQMSKALRSSVVQAFENAQ